MMGIEGEGHPAVGDTAGSKRFKDQRGSPKSAGQCYIASMGWGKVVNGGDRECRRPKPPSICSESDNRRSWKLSDFLE